MGVEEWVSEGVRESPFPVVSNTTASALPPAGPRRFSIALTTPDAGARTQTDMKPFFSPPAVSARRRREARQRGRMCRLRVARCSTKR